MNSSDSALITSVSRGGSSSRAMGGSGVSGRSWKSGCCFSLITRSDLGISRTGGSMRIGSWSSMMRLRSSSTAASRATAAISPAFSSRRRSMRPRTVVHSHSIPAPMRSMIVSHDSPVNSDTPIAKNVSSTSVPPVKPSVAEKRFASTAPSMPPGARGRVACSEWKRSASSPLEANSRTENPASARMNGRRSPSDEPSRRR